MATELEVLEYVLGLDALGEGLGHEAGEILKRCVARSIRRLVVRQEWLLKRRRDVEAAAIDGEIAAAWEECLQQLKTLWLTQGRGLEDVG